MKNMFPLIALSMSLFVQGAHAQETNPATKPDTKLFAQSVKCYQKLIYSTVVSKKFVVSAQYSNSEIKSMKHVNVPVLQSFLSMLKSLSSASGEQKNQILSQGLSQCDSMTKNVAQFNRQDVEIILPPTFSGREDSAGGLIDRAQLPPKAAALAESIVFKSYTCDEVSVGAIVALGGAVGAGMGGAVCEGNGVDRWLSVIPDVLLGAGFGAAPRVTTQTLSTPYGWTLGTWTRVNGLAVGAGAHGVATDFPNNHEGSGALIGVLGVSAKDYNAPIKVYNLGVNEQKLAEILAEGSVK